MDISRVKYNLNKPVVFTDRRQNTEGRYILRGCIIRKSDTGEFFYQAEIQDLCGHSVCVVRLEDIRGMDV